MAGRVVFLNPHPFLPAAASLGGTEQAILHLADALRADGCEVLLAGAGADHPPLARAPDADLTVAVNDAALLPANARRTAVWFHNEVTAWREWRRGRWPALRRHRPIGVFLGDAHRRAASRWLPLDARLIIPHGVADAFAATAREPPPPLALFTSQAYRHLAPVLALWRDRVRPAAPAAYLEALIAPADIPVHAPRAASPGIALRPRLPNAAMPAKLATARALLAPGHASETFCLAAAEAIACGVPIITRGWGALADRVRDGETGLICRSWPAFAAATLSVLTDDALWRRLHAGCLATPPLRWREAADHWRALIPPS